MKTTSCLSRFPIPFLTIVPLLILAWSGYAFCGEIHDAAKQGNVVRVRELLKEDPSLVFSKNKEGWQKEWEPLHFAAAEGYKDVAELLIDNKAKVNAKAGDGCTPLNRGALMGHKDVVEFLLANKANVNARCDNTKDTPLLNATAKGHKDIVEILLANGAKVNVKEIIGDTPLHNAALYNGNKDIAELLLANGAKVNAKNDNSYTPLHYAAMWNQRLGTLQASRIIGKSE